MDPAIRPSASQLAATLESQAIVAQVDRPTLANGAQCVTMFLGLDNRSLLPPFLPSLWSEDVLFGRLLRRCKPDAYAAELPFLLVHDPPGERDVSLSVQVEQVGVEFAYLLGDLLESVELGVYSSVAARMRALAMYLVELGEANSREFCETCRLQFLGRTAARLERIERGLRSARRAPRLWVESAERRLRALKAAAVDDQAWIPFDLRWGRTADEAAVLAQSLTMRFGRLLLAWPAIWEAARRMDWPGGS